MWKARWASYRKEEGKTVRIRRKAGTIDRSVSHERKVQPGLPTGEGAMLRERKASSARRAKHICEVDGTSGWPWEVGALQEKEGAADSFSYERQAGLVIEVRRKAHRVMEVREVGSATVEEAATVQSGRRDGPVTGGRHDQ